MGQYAAWFQALFLQPPKCLGVQLKPYCYAHYEVLRKFRSPYLMQDGEGNPAPTTRKDLLFAVWVCSRTYEQLQSQLFGHRDSISMLFLNWRTRRKEFEIGDAQMHVYMEDYKKTPKPLTQVSEGQTPKTFAAPISFHVTRHLREHEGFTNSEAWNFPMGLGRCYLLTWREAEGLQELESEQMEVTAEWDKRRVASMYAELEEKIKDMPPVEADRIRQVARAKWGVPRG